MAASPHSWDFLLLRLRELRLPLLRGSASRTPGPTAKSIADIPPRGGWQSKLLFAAHRVLLAAMFSLFYASRAVARDAETNNDRGENCMSHFVFPPSAWFSQLTRVSSAIADGSEPCYEFSKLKLSSRNFLSRPAVGCRAWLDRSSSGFELH